MAHADDDRRDLATFGLLPLLRRYRGTLDYLGAAVYRSLEPALGRAPRPEECEASLALAIAHVTPIRAHVEASALFRPSLHDWAYRALARCVLAERWAVVAAP